MVSEKYIAKLIKKIKQQTNETVFVGLAKMNGWETFGEWKKRAMKNLKNAKSRTTTETDNNSTFLSDINVAYANPNVGDEKEGKEEKNKQASKGVVKKMETKSNLSKK